MHNHQFMICMRALWLGSRQVWCSHSVLSAVVTCSGFQVGNNQHEWFSGNKLPSSSSYFRFCLGSSNCMLNDLHNKAETNLLLTKFSSNLPTSGWLEIPTYEMVELLSNSTLNLQTQLKFSWLEQELTLFSPVTRRRTRLRTTTTTTHT